ncbi:uracil-DNA glycosylase family protein [Olsenella uli]|uniref:uracil-DNA glycosylase family protein n=1 Tax=Olsenella uli TaxID=133926 RepID=UPI0012AB8561|nr:uracil-DNA glycosylase family protein [Olsenella uli]
MTEYQHKEHGFEPVFDGRSRVLILGSLPSVLSRANAFYYGNPQNRFWRVVARVCGEPVPPNEGEPLSACEDVGPGERRPSVDGATVALVQSIEAKRSLLLRHGIALWDTVHSCDIKGSSDASIKNVVPADVVRVTSSAPIEAVFCNGGTSGRLYHRYLEHETGLKAVVLPSTSPANASWSLPRLVERWGEALSPYLGGGPSS